MIGACMVDEQGKVIHMNLAGSQLLGWGARFPSGEYCHKLLECVGPMADGQEEVCPLAGSLAEKKVIWIPRTRLRTKMGMDCWVELKGVAVDTDHHRGSLLMFRGLQKEMDRAEECRQLASIPEESPIPIVEIESNGVLRYANPPMQRLMEEAPIRSDGFTAALPEESFAPRTFSQSKGYLGGKFEVNVGDKWFNWIFTSHPDWGLLRGYGIDITESKRATEEFSAFADTLEEKNQELDQALIKAEAATRAKAAFLATMSHEIRTPLNGVIGMAEILLGSALDRDQQECIQTIRNAGEGLLTVMNDILDFSKAESGYMSLEKMEFDLGGLVQEVIDLFSQRANQHSLDLAAYVEPSVPRQLWGDRHRLRQILSNFLSNAIKFTERGSVLLRVTLLGPEHVWCKDSSSRPSSFETPEPEGNGVRQWVRLSVEDTGIGIPDEAQERIFQVFTQADSSMSRKFGGSGLGLAICKQLAELMNGTVGLKSCPDQGSIFWCDIPFQVPRHSVTSGNVLPQPLTGEVWVVSHLEVSTWVVSQYVAERGVKVVPFRSVENVFLQFTTRSSSELPLRGVILGEPYMNEWIEKSQKGEKRRLEILNLPIWGLKPLWCWKDEEDLDKLFDGIISLPLHRDQLFSCVFSEQTRPNDTSSREPKLFSGIEGEGMLNKGAQRLDPQKPIHGPTVLIVEDNLINQKVAAGLFVRLGCHVLLAEKGSQALDLVQDKQIDLIIMDWELPEMDGLTTTQAIRELERCGKVSYGNSKQHQTDGTKSYPHLPIIGLTAHGSAEHTQACLDGGMDDCRTKPIHLEDLKDLLRQWVGYEPLTLRGSSSPTTKSSSEKACIRDSPEVQRIGDAPHGLGGGKVSAMQVSYNIDRALEAVDGDVRLLSNLLQIFLGSVPPLLGELHEALAMNNRKKIHQIAHKLKGSLATLHADSEAKMAENLEWEIMSLAPEELETRVGAFDDQLNGLILKIRKMVAILNTAEICQVSRAPEA